MSSPVDRFRIPGGSLDLDSDDEREGVPAQANLVPSPGPPQIRSQIAHLTPDGLSNVLSRICHPLASRTAEYVRALNLSGNAFRNLDLAALNVLSNHDSAMAEQLLRIQAVLPCSLALESPIQEQDRAFLTANESLSPIGHSPKNVDPSISSSFAESLSMHPTTASPSTSVNIAGSTPPPLSSNTELPSHDTNQHFEDHPSLERRSAAGHSSNELAGDLTSLMQPESQQDDARTAPSSDGHDPRQSSLASQDTSVIGPSAHGGDTTIAPSGADAILSSPSNPQPSASQNETAGQALPPRSSSPSHSSPFVPPEALPSLLPHLATTDIPITGAEIEGSVEPQSPAGNQCDTSSDSGTSNAQTDSSRDTPDADNVMVTLTSGRFSSEPSSEPKASMACHDSSQDGASSDGPALDSGGAVHSGMADQGTSPMVIAEADISLLPRESGAISTCDPHIPTSPIRVSASDKISPDSDANTPACALNSNSVSGSSVPSQRDIVTPASNGSTSCSVLETPPPPDHEDDPSFLELDLLHFSPFSLGARSVYDDQTPSINLFKGTARPPGTTVGSCEGQWECGIDSGSDESPETMLLAHGTSTPLSTQSPTSLRDKGLTSFPDKNSTHDTGDGSPAIYMDEVSAEHVQNRANQARGHAEVYSCSRAEKAVDALPIKRKKDGEGSASACDADSSSRVDLASPNASSARPCVPCVCEAPFIHANRPLGATSVDKDRTCSLSAPHSADDEDIHSMESVDETCGPQASSGRTSRPSLLALAIPISPTSLEEELFQASPLFSPIERDARPPTGETTGDSKFEHLFSESAFSASRVRRTELPVKLKRGARAQRVARGTDTFDLSSPPSKRVLLDASIQTNEDVEVEYLRRRVKALERELRSLRATVRRSEDRVRESKPKSFWKKLASTDRLVPSPEPLRFGLLKDVSKNLSSIGQGSFGASTSS